MKEDRASWLDILRWLKQRGLNGTRLFITDKCLGLVEALGERFPKALWQRCIVHFYRNVLSVVPTAKVKEVAAMLKVSTPKRTPRRHGRRLRKVVAKLTALAC